MAETNKQDISTIFHEMNPEDEPLFVARNLNKVPSLIDENFCYVPHYRGNGYYQMQAVYFTGDISGCPCGSM